MTRRELMAETRKHGVYLTTFSPGDGSTRYQFQTRDVTYFNASDADKIATVIGLNEAVLFWQGYKRGARITNPSRSKSKKTDSKRKRKSNPSGPLDLDVDTADKVPVVLHQAAAKFFESEAELESAWQDKRAGRVWGALAKILDLAGDKAYAAVKRYLP